MCVGCVCVCGGGGGVVERGGGGVVVGWGGGDEYYTVSRVIPSEKKTKKKKKNHTIIHIQNNPLFLRYYDQILVNFGLGFFFRKKLGKICAAECPVSLLA